MIGDIKEKLWASYKLDKTHPCEGIYLLESKTAETGICLAFTNKKGKIQNQSQHTYSTHMNTYTDVCGSSVLGGQTAMFGDIPSFFMVYSCEGLCRIIAQMLQQTTGSNEGSTCVLSNWKCCRVTSSAAEFTELLSSTNPYIGYLLARIEGDKQPQLRSKTRPPLSPPPRSPRAIYSEILTKI